MIVLRMIIIIFCLVHVKDNSRKGVKAMELLKTLVKGNYYFVASTATAETQRHLANLGLVKGAGIRILQRSKKGEMIILVKESRLALTADLVKCISVSEEPLVIKRSQTLAEVSLGQLNKVEQVLGQGAIRRRLMDMGITRGTEIMIRKVAPLGDPLEITVRGYELSLRKAEAELVLVKEV